MEINTSFLRKNPLFAMVFRLKGKDAKGGLGIPGCIRSGIEKKLPTGPSSEEGRVGRK